MCVLTGSNVHILRSFCRCQQHIHGNTASLLLHTRHAACTGSSAYGQGVVHSDDAAVQDGRSDGGDFQSLAIPRVGAARSNVVPSHVGDHVTDGLCLPTSQIGLGLENGSFGHNQTRGAVLYFCVDWDSFTYNGNESRVPSGTSHKALARWIVLPPVKAAVFH